MSVARPVPVHSQVVERAVAKICDTIPDEELRETFRRCVFNTLETTVVSTPGDPPDTYVITGDIPAMWLRDSAAQLYPYMRFLREDDGLARVVRGLVHRHHRCVLLDPYANAFTFGPNDASEHATDLTTMKPGVFERKYEVDSLCAVIHLTYRYWQVTGDTAVLDDTWRRAMQRILDVWTLEQHHEERSGYRFARLQCPPTDTLENDGRGTPVGYTRMTWSGFRPSDDACELHYHIPSQAYAVVCLRQLGELAATMQLDEMPAIAQALSADIDAGLREFGIVGCPETSEPMFAYEVDGMGNCVEMDDANLPSLLGLPWLGYCEPDDSVYVSTRRFVLSDDNPYYVEGAFAKGVGSPHTPVGRVWPLSLITQAMTSTEPQEIHDCLHALLRLHAGTRLMHESVDPDHPPVYSRAWFAWANSMFGELVFHLAEHHPEVLVDFRLHN